MSTSTKKVKLTQHDRKILSSHSQICTDLHGKGCSLQLSKEQLMKLN
jgi:hypothetical protein